MRWSVVIGVCVVAAVIVVNDVGASRRISVVDQGYEGVVVGVSPTLNEGWCLKTIKVIKEYISSVFKHHPSITPEKLLDYPPVYEPLT